MVNKDEYKLVTRDHIGLHQFASFGACEFIIF